METPVLRHSSMIWIFSFCRKVFSQRRVVSPSPLFCFHHQQVDTLVGNKYNHPHQYRACLSLSLCLFRSLSLFFSYSSKLNRWFHQSIWVKMAHLNADMFNISADMSSSSPMRTKVMASVCVRQVYIKYLTLEEW